MLKPRRKIFFGWWIVAGALILDLYIGGTFSIGFTAFFKPLVDEFGWSYFAVSLAASIRGIESGIGSPVAGFLADRYGPRRIALVGVSIMGLGFILLSYTHSLTMFYISFAVMAIGSSGASGVVMMTAVSNWFEKKISRAMGFMVAGYGAGGIMLILVVWLINSYGWRNALLVLGISTWVVCLPAALLLRHKPEQYGYLPDGKQPDNSPPPTPVQGTAVAKPAEVKSNNIELSPGEALKTSAFWLISLSMSVRLLMANAVGLHVMPYLIGIGFSQGVAATVAASTALISIVGRIGFGWLGDIMDKRKVIAIAYGLLGLGMLAFVYANTGWALVLFVVSFGVGNGGTVPLRASIQREYFGRSAFGSIQGLIIAAMTAGGVIGPALAGWIYDSTGAYTTAWLSFAALAGLAIPMILLTKRPVKRKNIAQS